MNRKAQSFFNERIQKSKPLSVPTGRIQKLSEIPGVGSVLVMLYTENRENVEALSVAVSVFFAGFDEIRQPTKPVGIRHLLRVDIDVIHFYFTFSVVMSDDGLLT
jgi:type III secretory pathway lipoprotein EscJ